MVACLKPQLRHLLDVQVMDNTELPVPGLGLDVVAAPPPSLVWKR
jgi:hypothetical protein